MLYILTKHALYPCILPETLGPSSSLAICTSVAFLHNECYSLDVLSPSFYLTRIVRTSDLVCFFVPGQAFMDTPTPTDVRAPAVLDRDTPHEHPAVLLVTHGCLSQVTRPAFIPLYRDSTEGAGCQASPELL